MDYLEKVSENGKHSLKRYLKAGSRAINIVLLKHLHWGVVPAEEIVYRNSEARRPGNSADSGPRRNTHPPESSTRKMGAISS